MKAVRFILVLSFVILFSIFNNFGQNPTTPSQPAPQQTSTTFKTTDTKDENKDERYRIGFQDTLSIQVFRHPELAQTVTLNQDGTIFLFRAEKPISAICKTERELANVIAKEYLSFLKKPEVNVIAVEKKSQSFGVIGAVDKPGTYFINRQTRLIELLSFAGGPTKEAGSRLIVARTGSSSACKMKNEMRAETENDDLVLMSFKIKDVLEAKQNLWMKPGDIVSVLDADVIYVYGNVNEEGPVKLKEPITLTQAIVSAKGFKPSTKKDKIRIIRQKEGSSEREELVYDLNEISKRKVEDPFLQPNDIVAVSEDPAKAIFKKLGDTFTGGIGGLFYRIP